MKKKLMKSAARVLGTVAAVIFAAWFVVAQPSCCGNHPSGEATDPAKLREHVETLSQRLCPRDWLHRNKAYHSAGDTSDRLDYKRLAKVVLAVFETVKGL